MKVELKLYKNFDADLLSLHIGGISVTNLMKIALKGYVNDNTPNFHIPETRKFSLEGRKRFLHVSFEINDKKSIQFLKTEIKNRQRSAFLKSLLRGCLVAPNLGVYLKNTNLIENESKRISSINNDGINNLIIIEYPDLSFKDTKKKIRIEEITPISNYTQNTNHVNEDKKEDTVDYSINNDIIDEYNDNDKTLVKDEEEIKEIEDDINASDEEETISEEDLEEVDQDDLMAQFLNLKS